MKSVALLLVAFIGILWPSINCNHYAGSIKRQLKSETNGHSKEALNDRQIVEELLKKYRFPDPSANISVGVSIYVERILDANEDLCHLQILIVQKWLETRLRYDHVRDSTLPVRLRSLDYIWSPALIVENALSVLPVGKHLINVFNNGIVEYEQRVQVLVQAETNLRNYPFEHRNCSLFFSNDDGRAIWNRILEVKTSKAAKQGIGEWKLLGTRTAEVKALQIFIGRSINQHVIMMFLPTLGFLLIGWFAAWFFTADDSRRLYSGLISLGGVCLTESKSPQTGFLKASDYWLLIVSATAFLNLCCVIVSGVWTNRVGARRSFVQRSSYDAESENKARWIVANTPYYSQLEIDGQSNFNGCKCCIASLSSTTIIVAFGGFLIWFWTGYVLPYYRNNNRLLEFSTD
ncbi:Gamma-aminobutyric acid receptor subunit pi [Aphelenchoides bicaudatus]|nr:Gamma-aminobutyric acid receptor subunit pi [Aphelenchoides bicaudatus]